MRPRSRASFVSDRVLVIAFLTFVMLPLVGTPWGWDVYEVQENRRLTPFPDLATTTLAELPDAFDAYYRDHFGFRNFFIRRWNRLLRRLDKNLLRRVIQGRDQWLYYDRPDLILDYLGRLETTDEDLEYWRSAIEGRQSWLADRGIHYLFAVAPNKPSIYPEMLPEDLQAAARPTRLDLLVEYMEAHSDVQVLDIRPAMRAKKDWKTLYLSNDTHWNGYGAFIAYRTVVSRLREQLPELDPALELSECRVVPGPHYGDLARHADLPTSEYTITNVTIDPPTIVDFETSELSHPVFTPGRVWPGGNMAPPVYRCPSGHGRAVLFHDSFFLRATRLFAHHFEESTHIWHRATPEALTAVVEEQKPDVVVEVVAERTLHQLPEQFGEWEEARRRRHGTDTSRTD